MKKSLVILMLIALLIGSLSLGVLAQGQGQGWGKNCGPNGGPNSGKGPGGGMGFQALDLSADQQKQMLEIRQAFERDTLSLRTEMQKANQELRKLWTAKPLNQNAIVAKNGEVTTLQVQMGTKAKEMQAKIKAVLTVEQLKKLDEQKALRGKGFQKGMMGRKGKMGNGMGKGNGGFMMGGLTLTAEQQSQMLSIRQKFDSENLGLKQDLQKKELELRGLMKATSLDQKAIVAKSGEVTALRVQLANKSQALRAEMEKVLTAEQKAEIRKAAKSNTNSGWGNRVRR